ncbi:MAG TPA: type II toxin-antitoxin system RelE/ParE family toxin [Phycisphaerae bacterium]|nr:type II toxin-antitoxin system RelE/ParE family toxin [Phycisphaerae bacterium]
MRALPREILERIDRSLDSLADNPRPPGCTKLRSKSPEGWRVRVGDYRILYQIDDRQRQVLVYHVGHRRDVYQ